MSTATVVTPAQGALGTIQARRAVRSYLPDVVPQERLEALLAAAVRAPTAMHQEPWRFVVVQDRALLERLSARGKAMALERMRHHGDLLRPAVAGGGLSNLLADPAFNIFYDAGTLVVICAEPANDFVVADCWLAAENLMLAACADGLGTCCIGFAVPVLNAADVKAELGIPDAMQAYAPVIVGVPRDEGPPTPRKAPVVLRWIR
jgi:nitroreductase